MPSGHNPQNASESQKAQIRTKLRKQRSQLSLSQQQQASQAIFQQLIAHPHISAARCIAAYLPTQGEIDLTPFIHWAWQQGKRIALPVIHPTQAGDMRFHQYFSVTEASASETSASEALASKVLVSKTSASETPASEALASKVPASKGLDNGIPKHILSGPILLANRYGILEPNPSLCPCLDAELDGVLTPLVAFDHQGTRLGMGGGYYDRFYARCTAHNSEQGTATIPFIGVAYDFQQVEFLPKDPWDMQLTDVLVS